ncbi:MAG: MOSC domain-containing protein [Bryobacteraceae bacterium]
MQGSILQINSSAGGLPKRAMLAGFISALGLEGDGHAHPTIHGGLRKAILLIASEIVDGLAARGYPVFYGAMGENLTTRGIDIRALRIGDRLRAGAAVLEITEPRGPCTALDVYGPSIKDEIYDRRVKLLDAMSPRWGMSGLYASVIEPGAVQPGGAIELFPMP